MRRLDMAKQPVRCRKAVPQDRSQSCRTTLGYTGKHLRIDGHESCCKLELRIAWSLRGHSDRSWLYDSTSTCYLTHIRLGWYTGIPKHTRVADYWLCTFQNWVWFVMLVVRHIGHLTPTSSLNFLLFVNPKNTNGCPVFLGLQYGLTLKKRMENILVRW